MQHSLLCCSSTSSGCMCRTSLPLVLPFLLPQVFSGCSWISRLIYCWEGACLKFFSHHCRVSGHWHFPLHWHELSNTRQHYSLSFHLCVTKLKNLNPCLDAWVRRQMSRAGIILPWNLPLFTLCSKGRVPNPSFPLQKVKDISWSGCLKLGH